MVDERRRFPRLNVPVLYRPARLLGPRKPAGDLSRGGIKVYTDEALALGTRLEIELLLPDGDTLTVDVRVAWTRPLSDPAARYEAGLEFLTIDAERLTALERCIDAHKVP